MTTNLFFSLFFGTFVLEDVALATALVLMHKGQISPEAAFMACFLGISIGDLGLFILGRLITPLKLHQKFKFFERLQKAAQKPQASTAWAASIVVSRMIPGTRIPTYVGAGFFKYPALDFFVLTVLSVFAWVLISFTLGQSVVNFFADHWVLGLLGFLFFLRFLKWLGPALLDEWMRKTILSSWKKHKYFEFWPAWFFYLPIVPIYLFLAIKHKSLFAPFFAMPKIRFGGLIGESKWDFLKHLKREDPTTLATVVLEQGIDHAIAEKKLLEQGIHYPMILKPDVGQRGFGVRIVYSVDEMRAYLKQAEFTVLGQQLSRYKGEAGLFYVRRPTQDNGFIFSITNKIFPEVVGDGKLKLGDLILNDKRANLIAPIYFKRLKEKLNWRVPRDIRVKLVECGNHCQGSIFENATSVATAELTSKVDQLAKQIPDLRFGRFDVRFENIDSLKRGEFEIVEINGSGSEATHIWDRKTSLSSAYKSLFNQWDYLFEIGVNTKKTSVDKPKLEFFKFLLECVRVVFRQGPLTTSS